MVIKQSTVNSDKFFNLNGLDYDKGIYSIFYNNLLRGTDGNIIKDSVNVGIRSKSEFSETLVFPMKITSWSNGTSNFSDLDSLIAHVISLINFEEGGRVGLTQKVDTFDELVSGTTIGDLAYVNNSQGTRWQVFTALGGTYYPKGWYVWNGTIWVSDKDAIANQLEENILNINDKANTSDLASVAFSNDYEDLTNTPTTLDGTNGVDGQSAYEIAVNNGFIGTETEWLDSLVGTDGVIGSDGEDGQSAYEVAVSNGFSGTEQEWLDSLQGARGNVGNDGKTAYEVAVINGFVGIEAEWLDSLNGADGASAYDTWVEETGGDSESDFLTSIRGSQGTAGQDGLSAYQLWLAQENIGTQADFINSLQGETGQSAYEVWLSEGNLGTETSFLNSLEGDVGEGVPTGGNAGEVLSKVDSSNYNTQWVSMPDYQEGDFTMTFRASSFGASGITWNHGKYTKIGRKVNCQIGFTFTGASGAISSKGSFSLNGLPFTPSNYWGNIDGGGVNGFVYQSISSYYDTLIQGGVDLGSRIWAFFFFTGNNEANYDNQILLNVTYDTDE